MLTAAALLPAIILMIYIYKKDKVEKEPKGLLLKIFFLGAFSVIPILIMEIVFEAVFLSFLEPTSGLYIFLEAFIGVAWVEEFWKRWAVKVGAWKHKAFNYRFDAIVYSVFAALGFAALENIMYVLESGLSTALLRAVTAVPSHAVDGIIMGYFLGEAKICELDGNKKGQKRYMKLSILMPTLSHGIYDYALFLNSEVMALFWLVFVVVIDIWAILFVRRASKKDAIL